MLYFLARQRAGIRHRDASATALYNGCFVSAAKFSLLAKANDVRQIVSSPSSPSRSSAEFARERKQRVLFDQLNDIFRDEDDIR